MILRSLVKLPAFAASSHCEKLLGLVANFHSFEFSSLLMFDVLGSSLYQQ